MSPRPACLVVVALVVFVGCRQRNLPIAAAASSDTDYLELTAGGGLSITVPYFKSGGYVARSGNAQEKDGTVTISGSDLIGFQVSRYSVVGKADGRVRLGFKSATTTQDGKEAVENKAPHLPFALPSGYRHIRLIYFVRNSQADHNMAIAASKNSDALSEFTKRMRADPQVCENGVAVTCVWVPLGVAVRFE